VLDSVLERGVQSALWAESELPPLRDGLRAVMRLASWLLI
jgi:hypothetical protein